MTLTRFVTPLAFVAALSLGVLPAQAQHRGGSGSRGGGGSRGGSVSRGAAVSRSVPVYSRGVYSRPYNNTYYRPYYNTYYRPYYNTYYRSYYRPYYSFVPRFSLGFGLTIGYPVAYPYYYPPAYSYGYPAYPPAAYGYGYSQPGYSAPVASRSYSQDPYAANGYGADTSAYQTQPQTQPYTTSSVNARPGTSSTGGVSLEVTPSTATVFVDGTYMGTADEFGPTSQPIGLTAGRHRIEVRANGYQTMTFEATITAGQVLPYQASLQRKQ